ncbi:MAG TPA: M13 family metallopeptidase [Sphingomicrobium sp.]|nr:M13 family metallopeptidase [Sphingomicrobium sp.]
MRTSTTVAATAALVFVMLVGSGLLRQTTGVSFAAPLDHPAPADVDISAIDFSADACTNFYQRACGGFLAKTIATPERPVISPDGDQFQARLQENLAKLFLVRAPLNSELGRLKTFYQSCTSDDPSNSAIVKDWVGRIGAAQSRREIQSLIRDLAAIGVDPLISYSGQPDPQKLTRYRGAIVSSNLWQDPTIVERTFIASGWSAQRAKAAADTIAAMLTELRKHRNMSKNPADHENPRTLAQLERMAPAIDWPSYFDLVGARRGRPVNVDSPDYVAALSQTLANRPVADLRDYLLWSFLFSLRGELPAPYNAAFADLPPPLRVDLSDRVKTCRDATVRAMGVEFSREYSLRILGIPTREAAMKISQSIRDQIVSSVSKDSWLSAASRKAMAEKLQRTDLKIGFPDRWPNVGNYSLNSHRFLQNVLSARRFEAKRMWHQAERSRARRDWEMIVTPWVGNGMAAARLVVPNGYPDSNSNSLIMTAAFLAPPTFDVNASTEANYATYGSVFAHEFVHVAENHEFDARGRQHEIWSSADLAAWNKQRQCVIDQSDNYPGFAGIKGSGKQTYDENVADLGGLRLAYQALLAKLGATINRADSSGMTSAQRFFYHFAQHWCTAETGDYERKNAQSDPHDLPEYRVNGPLSNLPAFGEAFGCRAGAPMRQPEAKVCRVW